MEWSFLCILGSAYNSLGQYEKAIDHHMQALAISREIHDRRGEGSRLGNLGNAYNSLGQYEKAIDHYMQALAVFDQLWLDLATDERRLTLGDTFHHISRQIQQAYLSAGQPAEALVQAERARSRGLELLLAEQRSAANQPSSLNGNTPIIPMLSIDGLRRFVVQQRVALVVFPAARNTSGHMGAQQCRWLAHIQDHQPAARG